MTYGEIIYMCLDEIKAMSDDAYVTEDHIAFLVSKYRSFLLRQKYDKTNMPVAKSNYETKPVRPNAGMSFPAIMNIATPIVYYETWVAEEGMTHHYITYVPFHRFQFVGGNKYLKGIEYCTVDPNGTFKVKLNKDEATPTPVEEIIFNVWAVFESIYNSTEPLDLSKRFPLEEELVAGVIELVVKDVLGVAYRPKDMANNSSDDLSTVGMLSGNPKNSK